ncbi:MAG: hypothetical protein J6V36_00905 [Clostridia bacterium]|nr:hypothetical protein [Clostridia bacterium]
MIEIKSKKSKSVLLFILAFVLAFSVIISTLPQKTVKALTVNEILNGAELHPIKTGYKSLDKQIEGIFAEVFTSGMTTYDKVWSLYKYMVETFEYDNSYLIYINRDIYPILNEVPYKSTDDAYEVFRALRILRLKLGACTYYSSLYMIMLRAIGLEAYTVTGQTSTVSGGYTGHTWVSVLINDVWYNFDPQVEDNITNRTTNKVVGKYRFCKTDSQLSGKIKGFNREEDMAEFGGFQIEGVHAPLLNGLSDGNTVYVYSGGTITLLPDVSQNENGITYSVYIINGNAESETEIRKGECIGKSLKSEEIEFALDSSGEYSVLVEATDGTNTSSSIFHIKAVNLYQCPPKTNVEGVQALLDDESAFITDKDGNQKTNCYIGTGDIINSELHSIYWAYVSGDTSGDGEISSTDYLQVKAAFLGSFSFDTLFAEAADYNHDGAIDSTDYLSIKKLMLG